MRQPITVVGAGLAGCSLAWHLHFRGIPFSLIDASPTTASSLAAAGMLSPVTGKAFNPSWRIEDFYEPALSFYQRVEEALERKIWYAYPVVRLFFNEQDQQKFQKKRERNPALESWVAETFPSSPPHTHAPHGAVVWKGSGRLDVKSYVTATRAYFQAQGQYEERVSPEGDGIHIYSTGAQGLIKGNPLSLPHRSAKGEILTLRIPGLSEEQIISRGTWIVPTGRGDASFLAGATYEWDDLTSTPTVAGREQVMKGVSSLITLPFTVEHHVAGVRPIVRKSEPVIGRVTGAEDYVMNGLGSKGVLYAPRTAALLLDHIIEEKEIPRELEVAEVLK